MDIECVGVELTIEAYEIGGDPFLLRAAKYSTDAFPVVAAAGDPWSQPFVGDP